MGTPYRWRQLPVSVLVLAMASFFTDLSSEMIYPLLPVFLSSVLGAGAIGGTIAALLSRGGHSVEVTARGENLAALQRGPLELQGAWGSVSASVSAAGHLTASPERAIRELCEFLGVPFEPKMLDYGDFDHAGFTPGLGDSSLNIRSGRIQPPAPLPEQMPAGLADICAAWGYPHPDNERSSVG